MTPGPHTRHGRNCTAACREAKAAMKKGEDEYAETNKKANEIMTNTGN